MNQEKYTEAAEAFQNGIDLGASDYLQELKFNQIVADEYLGEFDTAKSLIAEYVQSYPDDSNAKKEYEFLLSR
jgi:TolA-binding protein